LIKDIAALLQRIIMLGLYRSFHSGHPQISEYFQIKGVFQRKITSCTVEALMLISDRCAEAVLQQLGYCSQIFPDIKKNFLVSNRKEIQPSFITPYLEGWRGGLTSVSFFRVVNFSASTTHPPPMALYIFTNEIKREARYWA
jgi:hypothetical protein